jgi:hypothetical protein
VKRPIVAAAVALGLTIAVAIGAGGLGSGPAASQLAVSPSAARTPSSGGSAAVSTPGEPSPSGSGVAPPQATPTPIPTTLGDVPIVPVTQFRTARERTTRDEVAAVLAGTSTAYDGVELVASEADAILVALGQQRPADATRLILAPDPATLSTDLAAHRKRLAFLRADAVGPGVRALGWGGKTLFGVGRVTALAEWSLTARLPETSGAGFDPAKTWTLVAGGDIMLDRGVAETVKIKGKGVDFPFDGGTAEITSRYCCSSFHWDLPRTQRTGNAGAVRELISGADLAIANFENPAPDNFRYHAKGTVFSADPKLIKGLADAGIDYVGVANNHIGDAGRAGILQTIANLAGDGIASSGAGRNVAAAHKPALLDVGGVTLGILAYDTIARYYGAGTSRAGSAILSANALKADVAAARNAGADVVIVFPHWGTEYDPTPFKGQQALARAAIDAGADMVIGNHAHWAGAMETYAGKPIWYALGNFVFDQTWSEPTMEGLTLELTFRGADLVQARMRPHIILDKAQPNFLDPAGDGRVVMGQVFDASQGLLEW